MTAYARNPQTIPDDSVGGSTVREGVAEQNNVAINDLFTYLNAHANNEDGRSHYQIDQDLDAVSSILPDVQAARDLAAAWAGVAEERADAADGSADAASTSASNALMYAADAQGFRDEAQAARDAIPAADTVLVDADIGVAVEAHDPDILKADTADVLQAAYGDEAQIVTSTIYLGTTTLNRNHVLWTPPVGIATIGVPTIPYDGTYVIHLYPTNSTGYFISTSYKLPDVYDEPDITAGEVRIVIERFNGRTSIISIQNMGA